VRYPVRAKVDDGLDEDCVDFYTGQTKAIVANLVVKSATYSCSNVGRKERRQTLRLPS
jgi:hypothetical protein